MSDVTAQATISHALSATGSNDPSAEVQMSHWNQTHAASIVLAATALFGAFSNANGMSFGTSNGGGGNTVITGSYTVPSVPAQSVQTQASGDIARSGFTTTTAGGVVIAGTLDSGGLKVAVPAYLTTAALSADSSKYAGTGFTSTSTAGTDIKATLNTGGLSMAVPAYLTAAAGGGITNIKVSAGTRSDNRSDITFTDSNGISFGLATDGKITGTVKTDYLTTARASNDAIGLNTAKTNVTWTVNSSGISLDAGGYAGTGFTTTTAGGAVIAGTQDTAGLKLGVPAYLTTARASTDAVGLNTAKTNVTWTVNSSGISFDAGGYAGTGTSFGGTNLSGSMTLNTAGLTLSMSAAAPGGGAAPDLQYFEPSDEVAFGLMTNVTAVNTRPFFVPFILPGNLKSNKSLILQMSRSTSGSNAFTVQAALYSYANSTSLARIDSIQNVFSGSNTGSISGVRYFVMTGWGAGSSLTPGAYVLGLNFSANGGNTASMNYSLFGGLTASQPVGFVNAGSDQNNTTATNSGVQNFFGRYTANSAGMPANVAQADIIANFSGASVPLAPWFAMRP